MNSLRAVLAESDHADLVEMIDQVERFVHKWWATPVLPWFTDHGPQHSRRTANYAMEIAAVPYLPDAVKLRPLELAILWTGAWLHDLGMNSLLGKSLGPEISASQAQHIRHEHPNESANIILREADLIGIPRDPPLRQCIAYVARAHGTEYFASSAAFLGALNRVRNERVRGPLLGAILLLADELDLHYQRATPSLAHPELNEVSEAHALKHRHVLSCGVEHQAGGAVAFAIATQPPNGFSEVHSFEIETWILEKLRRQIAMVEEEFSGGFASYARISREVHSRRVPSIIAAEPTDRGVMRHIRADNTRSRLLDHGEAFRSVMDVVRSRSHALLAGALDETFVDLSGREDVLEAIEARSVVDGYVVLSSRCVYESFGAATLGDVLREWLSGLEEHLGSSSGDMGLSSVDQIVERIEAAILHAPRPFLISISSIDRMPSDEVDALLDSILPRLVRDGDVSALLTADTYHSVVSRSMEFRCIGPMNLDLEEATRDMSRYTTPASAQDEVRALRSYSQLRKLRDQHLLRLAGSA